MILTHAEQKAGAPCRITRRTPSLFVASTAALNTCGAYRGGADLQCNGGGGGGRRRRTEAREGREKKMEEGGGRRGAEGGEEEVRHTSGGWAACWANQTANNAAPERDGDDLRPLPPRIGDECAQPLGQLRERLFGSLRVRPLRACDDVRRRR